MKSYSAILAISVFGLALTGCQQTSPGPTAAAPPPATAPAPAAAPASNPSETTTSSSTKSVEVKPADPTDPTSTPVVKKTETESTTTKKRP